MLDVRRRVLESLRPGTTLGRLHQLSVRLLSEGLQQLRILPGMSVDAIAAQHYRCARRCCYCLCLGRTMLGTYTAGALLV